MESKQYFVFVYGTLLVGEVNHYVAEPYIQQIETGSVKGFLYNLGPYPALLLDESGMEVHGEWFKVSEDGLAQMDILEDFEEGRTNNLYERVKVNDLNKKLNGFAYVFNKEKIKHLPLIKSGSWKTRDR
ncbi:gamma-glutamylcyclotransferase family protein [Litchfieldia alkalitelluris]|uniref:gamma-glutamylcyclotransferase family protein n=1 Tax=Litchfieldia alkalitelluris TaxID=304268 RepID=UPI000998D6DE|nr:gamma-glutamylcyclotransferase family protein [Litchfieldia alkalitelluris]